MTSSEWNDHTVVCVDADYDRDRATDESRYDAYLRQYLTELDGVDDPAEFGAWAWRVASGPIMSPGYVRVRPDIEQIRIEVDYQEGGPIAIAEVPIHHHALARRPRAQDWTIDPYGHQAGPYRAVEEPSRKSLAVLVTATIVVPAGTWGLPEPVLTDGPALYARARAAIDALVQGVNADLAPRIAELHSR
ncbi:hypothetical protein [Streptomyces sp. SID3343]|uniref:hypothetical protein n=1 Tax=Streptomyces sp. SID3343 TaxID=2690260 RepID=UPI001367E60F|nr:hypothetical protein [Streptomyces sp. SID3343]MYW00215.1 hypothetical protein [Streptomyces sp. SID3343]